MKKFLPLLMWMVLGILSCDKYDLPADLTLKMNDDITVDGLRIRFSDIEESRCAEGVTCVWAGEAKVFLKLNLQDNVILKSPGLCEGPEACRDTATYKHYRIILHDVNPYPKINVEIKKEDYRIKLSVERN